MTPYLLNLTPLTAFGGALHGDTLFGQLCWTLAHRMGDATVSQLLQGYTNNQPFAVVSDAFLAGYLPKPHLPSNYFAPLADISQRKAAKEKIWLSAAVLKDNPSIAMNQLCNQHAKSNQEIGFNSEQAHQPHNSINRLSNTTGEAGFAPYQTEQHWYPQGCQLEVVVLIDTQRISATQIQQAFEDIGMTGYGRDASIGLGKFCVNGFTPTQLAHQPKATHYLSLANVAPQGLGFHEKNSFYKTFTRFGRHGSMAVSSGKPFKAPIMLATAASVFAHDHLNASYIGQGLGGLNSPISNHDTRTIHQGYAPVIQVRIEKEILA